MVVSVLQCYDGPHCKWLYRPVGKSLMNYDECIVTYKIYNIGYNTEMIYKQCNAGDPLETSGGINRGPHLLYNLS